MTLPFTIEDLDGKDYLVHFEFHRELDKKLVFDGAWTIQTVIEHESNGSFTYRPPFFLDDGRVAIWLENGGEASIYIEAERYF